MKLHPGYSALLAGAYGRRAAKVARKSFLSRLRNFGPPPAIRSDRELRAHRQNYVAWARGFFFDQGHGEYDFRLSVYRDAAHSFTLKYPR